MTKEALLKRLQAEVLKTPRIIAAFRAIDRADFVGEDYQALAYADTALPIGHDATISQPYTVAFMLEKLQPTAADRILDIGSGSGWAASLLAHIAGPAGKVLAIEIVPELVEYAQTHSAKYGFHNLEFFKAGTIMGLPEEESFNKILVSAAAEQLPDELVAQLKPGGTLVIPIQNSIWKVKKTVEGKIFKEEFPGFVFVPLK